MRVVAFAVFAFLATPAFAVPDDPSYPVMPDTPSGLGDPNGVTCRAPQALPGGGVGPKICMKNDIWVRLSLTGKDLSADGKSVFERSTVVEPNGKGNPDAVTCRRPVSLTATRNRFGPRVCLTNGQWKEIAARKMVVNSAGEILMRPVGPAADGAFPVTTVERSPPL
jgi:hypothetical protein